MELRELTSATERARFLRRVEQARAAGRADFRATSEAQEANNQRLDATRFYGLFEKRAAPGGAMVAGIAMHDLEVFPQSCREPDLSAFVPRTVVECSEHWSLSIGPGMMAWAGLAMPLHLLGVKAVLAYLAAGEGQSEHASFYSLMGFKCVGAVVQHPFVETRSGEPLRVQPVLAEGAALENGIQAFADACVDFSDDGRVFHLRPSLRPLLRRVTQRLRPSNRPLRLRLPQSPDSVASLPQ